ncbi:uncharacterized protein FMAN_09686 [Fusarium mangiferae]|uniref:Zn(2)-C6 fungal-type domain-containing protein n=1 Tax=Fusarium mangiferae TaxID=192010 RepID=A0A1L7UIU8_FUSMA|nr:uncharacterized protein FMAN_09686 [Fusarium mangiferae]CVL07975.1 uncharacterized protein FMAN_09686 [Fusarium mangiferae]
MPQPNLRLIPYNNGQTKAVIRTIYQAPLPQMTKRNVKRRRASIACLPCRKRKVRCDVTESGGACRNCRLDGQKCVVESKRSGGPKRAMRLGMRDEDEHSAETYRPISPSYWLDPDQPDDKGTTRCPALSTVDAYATPETEIELGVSPRGCSSISSFLQKDDSSNPPKRIPRLSTDDERELWSDKHVTIQFRTRACNAECSLPWTTGGFVLFPFYHFIRPSSLKETDTEVAKLLEQRGCLHVPAKHILDEFMEKYFSYFHPLVPILDEQRFWVSYGEQGETNGDLSLFVLQAMLFVSSPYVPLKTLIGLGFRTVQEAQDEFYIRATTLFDLQSTLSDQDRAQGAMMLTYRTVSFMDKKPLYWLSISIHYAKSAGAHRHQENQDTREGTLLKRLWWCCILRDQILALALHQSPLVNRSALETSCPALSVADFTHEIRTSRVYEHVDKQIIVRIAIVLCEFSDILGDILLLSPLVKERGFCRDEIGDHISRLDVWYDETYATFRLPTLMTGAHESLTLFSNILCTYYHAAKALIYNHTILSTGLFDGNLPNDLPDARAIAHTNLGCCFRSITENIIELKDLGLVQYLPITFINFSAAPLIWYLLQSHIQNSDVETQRDLDAQFDVMTQFSCLYRNAESTINYIKSIVEHIKISLPPPTNDFYSNLVDGDGDRYSTLSDESWSSRTWIDMLLKDPRRYLRIALAVEFSLARGRCPAEDDFPLWLSDHQQHKDELCLHSCSSRKGSDLDSGFFSEAVGDFVYEDQEASVS